jgi:hypothetical protein
MYFVLHFYSVPVMTPLAVVSSRWQKGIELNSIIIKMYFEWISCNSTATPLRLFYSPLIISFHPFLCSQVRASSYDLNKLTN